MPRNIILLKKRNLDIEAFRAYAISITICAHLATIVPEWNSSLTYFWLGGGVDLFFCVSGYLITGALLDLLRRGNSFWTFAKLFWVRRIFRLWPAALFWSTLVLLISTQYETVFSNVGQRLVFNSWIFAVLNVENYYIVSCVKTDPACTETPLWHYWSLSLEEQFYLILPFILFFTAKRKLLILTFLLFALFQGSQIRAWGTISWFARSDALLYGAALATTWYYYPKAMTLSLTIMPRWLYQTILIFLAIALIVFASEKITVYYHGFVAAIAGMMVLIVSINHRFLTMGRHSGITAAYLGSRSYSIYLTHLPIFYFVRFYFIHTDAVTRQCFLFQVITVLSGLALTILCAEFSFRVIESPLRLFGRKIAVNSTLDAKRINY